MSITTSSDDAGSATADPASSPAPAAPKPARRNDVIWGVRVDQLGQRRIDGPMPDPASDALTVRQMFSGGWRRWLFPGIWLIYLTETVGGISKHSHGIVAILAYLGVAAFAVLYLCVLPAGWIGFVRQLRLMFLLMLLLVVAEAFAAHEDALAMLVYVAVLCVATLGRVGLLCVAALTAVAAFVPSLIPSWHVGIQWDAVITLPLVALAMFGFFAIIRANRALTEARAEVARLAAENERTRIARDLHDLLGHSLTTITVKAQLARRLADVDPARAVAEIAEVEELTRRSLTQVRAAVAGYREVSLAGEIATAREVLRSAGIDAVLPKAVDEVRPDYDELFGWVLREAVTNVVRHSRATRCTVRLGRDHIEVGDDGHGVGGGCGTGLTGLRERVEAAGGRVSAGRGETGGWTVSVHMAPSARPAVVDISPRAGLAENATRP